MRLHQLSLARKVLITTICLSLLLVFVPIVNAQVVEESDPFVYQTEQLNSEIRRLKIQYRGELEEYRNLESQFQINQQQYENLGTLAALEDARVATQVAMEARARVLKTYLALLKVTLLRQTGVEVDQKQQATVALDRVADDLDIHHQSFADQEFDRVELDQLSDEFEMLGFKVSDVSHRSLALLSTAKLQSVYDKAFILNQDMEGKLATMGGALKSAQRRRAFGETGRKLEAILPILQELHGDVRKETEDGGKTNFKGIYNRMSDGLQDTFSNLTQLTTFLQEILDG